MSNLIPREETDTYRIQMEASENFSKSLSIKSDSDYEKALTQAKTVKEYLDRVVKRREEITKPLNVALKSARDMFKPIETSLENYYNIIKVKMVAFTDAKEAKAAATTAKIDARVEKGTLTQSEGNVKKFLNQVPQTVSTDIGRATTKKVKKYYVVSKEQIPLEFLEPDMVKIKASFKSGFPVPGIEERLESELSIG